MKLLTIALFIASFNLSAESEKLVCDRLQDQAYNSCAESICELFVEENGGTVDECLSNTDGDFHVEASECAYEEVEILIEDHNKKNPKKKVTCDH